MLLAPQLWYTPFPSLVLITLFDRNCRRSKGADIFSSVFSMARLGLAAAVLIGLAQGALGDLQTCGQAQYDPTQASATSNVSCRDDVNANP
jgi:hypothetical protein